MPFFFSEALLSLPLCSPSLCCILMLKTITWQKSFFFLIKNKVLFQTEKIIRKLTGIPLSTIVCVMRKLYIIEVKGLGLGSWKMLKFLSQGLKPDACHISTESWLFLSCPNNASQCLSDAWLHCVSGKSWSSYPFHYVWKKSRYRCMN